MSVSVSMPQLGESVTEGTVTRWLKREGDHVSADEPLLEVSTDKVDTEIPSPVSGILRGISVAEDETVAVGAELAVIDEDGAAPAGQEAAPAYQPPATDYAQPSYAQPASYRDGHEEPAAYSTPAPAEPAGVSYAGEGQEGAESPYVTPLVRKLAAEHAIDLGTVTGTGVGGRIRKQDVLEVARQRRGDGGPTQVTAAQPPVAQATPAPAAPPAPAAAPAPVQLPQAPTAPRDIVPSSLRGTTERLSRARQLIARRMVESLQISAQLTTVGEADVTAITRLRQRAKADFEAREGVRLSYLPFFALAALEALKVHPKLNAVLNTEAGQIIYHDAEHLGIAVDTERGLMVPVIRNAGDLNIGGLARKIADLAARTRSGQVSPDELAGGTFTITNTGSRGALFDTPIINQPQVAILGTGTVVKRPVVMEDPALGEVITVRSMVYLALTYDHRLIDGADAARFLRWIAEAFEQPFLLSVQG